MDEINTKKPTIDDCMEIVHACCQILEASIKHQGEAQKIQFDICDKMINRLDSIIELCDKRTERIENAAKDFALSAKSLAVACETNNEIVQHLEKTYTSRIDQLVDSREELMRAYTKLLHEYVDLKKEFIDTLKELARRDRITNNTYAE